MSNNIIWTPLAIDSYMKIEYITQFCQNLTYIRDLINAVLGVEIDLIPVETADGWLVAPTASYINRIERNLDVLADGGCRPANMEPAKQWYGEDSDLAFLDFLDVNRWFLTLILIEKMIYCMDRRIRITGNYCLGENATRQIVRTI